MILEFLHDRSKKPMVDRIRESLGWLGQIIVNAPHNPEMAAKIANSFLDIKDEDEKVYKGIQNEELIASGTSEEYIRNLQDVMKDIESVKIREELQPI